MRNNLQYKRTDRDITDAFLKLLQKKPFEKIIVQDIMEEAMVNRSTFYQHFRDKYEVAEKLQTYYVTELKRTLEDISKKSPTHFEDISELTKAYFIENRTVLKVLIKIKIENVDIIKEWNHFFKDEYLSTSNSPTAEIEASIFSGISVAFMTYYIENESITTNYAKMYLDVFMNTAMRMFTLENDKDIKEMIYQKITENYSHRIGMTPPDK